MRVTAQLSDVDGSQKMTHWHLELLGLTALSRPSAKGRGIKKIVDRGQDMGETRRDGDVADFVADTSASLSAHETLNKSVIS